MTREDRATQLLICSTLSFAIISEHAKDWDTEQIIQKPYNKPDRCRAILYNKNQLTGKNQINTMHKIPIPNKTIKCHLMLNKNMKYKTF